MALSSYPGLRSMGYVSLLGTLYCMLTTVMVLVALFTLIDKRGRTEAAAKSHTAKIERSTDDLDHDAKYTRVA